MTYNFDPDRWYENELAFLEARRNSGRLNGPEYDEAFSELEERYEEMVLRLDGTYRLPD